MKYYFARHKSVKKITFSVRRVIFLCWDKLSQNFSV